MPQGTAQEIVHNLQPQPDRLPSKDDERQHDESEIDPGLEMDVSEVQPLESGFWDTDEPGGG